MSVFWCLIWGVSTFAVMMVTIKYYLPKLADRTQKTASETKVSLPDLSVSSTVKKEDSNIARFDFENRKIASWTIVILCSLFACACGYTAFVHSVSTINLFKITLSFLVLACVFITDLEYMIIPNLCSLILLSGRVITVVLEFILERDMAFQWLINSLVALIISAIILFILSKLTHGGLGEGDVKIFISLGFLCGIRAICFTFVLAFLACALTSTLLLFTKKKQLKDLLPLGPFILIGFGISVLLSII